LPGNRPGGGKRSLRLLFAGQWFFSVAMPDMMIDIEKHVQTLEAECLRFLMTAKAADNALFQRIGNDHIGEATAMTVGTDRTDNTDNILLRNIKGIIGQGINTIRHNRPFHSFYSPVTLELTKAS